MEKSLPRPVSVASRQLTTNKSPSRRTLVSLLPAVACFLVIWYGFAFGQGIKFWEAYTTSRLSPQAAAALSRCASLHEKPGPPANFHSRSQSDRYVPGTKPVLLKNAKIWSGDKNGTDVFHSDILLDKGIIKGIGRTALKLSRNYKEDIEVIDVKDAWVTPGWVFLSVQMQTSISQTDTDSIVDLHSHMGDGASPSLDGADDTNSFHGTVQPWLRALDGLNTHDESYALSISGGVTTALVLPGSANAIGEWQVGVEALYSSKFVALQAVKALQSNYARRPSVLLLLCSSSHPIRSTARFQSLMVLYAGVR